MALGGELVRSAVAFDEVRDQGAQFGDRRVFATLGDEVQSGVQTEATKAILTPRSQKGPADKRILAERVDQSARNRSRSARGDRDVGVDQRLEALSRSRAAARPLMGAPLWGW